MGLDIEEDAALERKEQKEQEQRRKSVENQLEQMRLEQANNSDSADEGRKDENCAASDHFTKFNPQMYLESFYKTAGEDLAMQVVLFFLPGILYRLPQKITTMLDLGAGPTVYLPIACRDRVETIYTSDYAPANREALVQWIEKKNPFDWTKVCSWIASIEASRETAEVMQDKARKKMKAVLDVNVHACPVVKNVDWKATPDQEIPEQFDLVTTVFCLEYSGETLQDYLRAAKGACSLVKPGGYLMQGGVLDVDSYHFDGKKFRSHRLFRDHVILGLKENGMCADEEMGERFFKFMTYEDVYIFISKKME